MQLRAMGSQLSKSRWSGILISLTFFVIVFWSVEAYLRIYYVTTDGFGFTTMTYWWYQNFYYKNLNSFGYRDDEPTPAGTILKQRISVVGDSFTAGHGIDDPKQTFALLLEQQLGEGYDVNLIAQAGWDTRDENKALDAYYKTLNTSPNVVVLSYYINDIVWLLTNTPADPKRNFTRLGEDEHGPFYGFLTSFFGPNYVYYNILQFTSGARTGNHLKNLVDAYLDDSLWNSQKQQLQQTVDWANAHDAILVVLNWPNPADIETSQPSVQRVSDFFIQAGIQVVDMSPLLRGKSTRSLIVNPFDTHPSVEAHKLAAQALYDVIVQLP